MLLILVTSFPAVPFSRNW